MGTIKQSKIIKSFFSGAPTLNKLKKLEGFYSVTIPKSYVHIGVLVELICKENCNVVLRFKKERNHMDVIKI